MRIEFALRDAQIDVLDNLNRISVLLAHRRFGKTVLAVIVLIIKIMECKHRRPQGHYFAPSYSQAKKVAWAYIKDYTQDIALDFNESELKVVLPGNRTIQLGSADNPHSNRGIYSDYAVLDEPAQMSPKMWTEVIRPALSDRIGGALFIGTPKGRHGLLYDLYQDAPQDPDMWRGMFKASETGIIDPNELASARRTMSQAEYDQEYECSFDASIKGAYWGAKMAKIEREGHIKPLIHMANELVYTSWDLGINDATAVWFWQYDGDLLRFIDHEEYENMGLPDIVAEMRAKGYQYGRAVVPHDAAHRSLSTGLKRSETLRNLGIETVQAPKAMNQGDVADHIDVTRTFLDRCYFDVKECKYGIEALRQYSAIWDDKKGVGRMVPDHNWCSHSADSMRYLATTPADKIKDLWGAELVYQ